MPPAGHVHTPSRRGESRPFHFESRWELPVRLEIAWEALVDVADWGNWWPGMRTVAFEGRDENGGVGSRLTLAARSPAGPALVFEVELTAVEPLQRLEFGADGDLRGHGSWTCHGTGDGTTMEILWCVVSSRRAIRLSRPVATWAHGRLMARGEAGLRRWLERT